MGVQVLPMQDMAQRAKVLLARTLPCWSPVTLRATTKEQEITMAVTITTTWTRGKPQRDQAWCPCGWKTPNSRNLERVQQLANKHTCVSSPPRED